MLIWGTLATQVKHVCTLLPQVAATGWVVATHNGKRMGFPHYHRNRDHMLHVFKHHLQLERFSIDTWDKLSDEALHLQNTMEMKTDGFDVTPTRTLINLLESRFIVLSCFQQNPH